MSTAEEVRKRAMERVGETRRRTVEDEESEGKRRRSGTDTINYLRERHEGEKDLRERELELRREEKKGRVGVEEGGPDGREGTEEGSAWPNGGGGQGHAAAEARPAGHADPAAAAAAATARPAGHADPAAAAAAARTSHACPDGSTNQEIALLWQAMLFLD